MNDCLEVAMRICGLDPEDDDNFEDNCDKVEEILYEKFGIDEEQFEDLIKALSPFACRSKSPLTDEIYQGFADHEKQIFLYKSPVLKNSGNVSDHQP